MDTLRFIAMIAQWGGFVLAIWNGVKLLLSASANAGTRLSKKVGRANSHTEGAIAYTNDAMKRQVIRIIAFSIIGLTGLTITYLVKR